MCKIWTLIELEILQKAGTQRIEINISRDEVNGIIHI